MIFACVCCAVENETIHRPSNKLILVQQNTTKTTVSRHTFITEQSRDSIRLVLVTGVSYEGTSALFVSVGLQHWIGGTSLGCVVQYRRCLWCICRGTTANCWEEECMARRRRAKYQCKKQQTPQWSARRQWSWQWEGERHVCPHYKLMTSEEKAERGWEWRRRPQV